MGRQVDGDPRRRSSGGAAGPPDRPPPVAVAYDAPMPPPPRQARGSAKMKMESLIAAVDSTEPMLQFPDANAAKSRRKRAKKTREDDDWRPNRYESVEYAAAPAPRAMAPASILNPAPPEATSAINDARNGSVYQYQVETVAPPQGMASVFHEMPVIQSFAETERRRAGLDGPTGVSVAAANVVMPQVIAEPSQAAAPGQTESLNGGLSAASRNGPAILTSGLSVFEVYFPFARNGSGEITPNREQEPNGSAGNGRSLKRKRRSETGSGRPSRRSGKEDDSGVSKYDLLRFDVDSVKLVPQGLVDRVEPKMSSAFIAKVIRSHVDNWCRRSGFGNNFVSEATTLLTAYYPCNYPTLLDEVLAGFLFTCPEYIDKFLPAMIAKYYKTAESVTSAKHPVIDAFARQCLPVRGSYETRHDLACLTLLRCLVEKNTEKFLLSPSIAVCAIECSDAVLDRFWLALLSAMRLNGVTNESDGAAAAWNVYEPSHQVYELLMLDDKLRSRYASDSRRISESFVRAVLFNRSTRAQVIASYPDLLQLALSSVFADTRTAWTTSLFNDWVAESARVEGDSPAFPLEDLIKLVLEFCATVNTQKTNWFANHILGYVLSEQYPSKDRECALSEIIRRYMPLLLGAVSAEDAKFVADVFWNQPAGSVEDKNSNGEVTRQEPVKTPAVAEKTSPAVHAERLESLLSFLASCDEKSVALFLKLWAAAWANGSDTTVEPLAWSYIRALVLVLVKFSSNQGPDEGSHSVNLMVCDLAERTSRSFFQRLQVVAKNEKCVLPQVTAILNESLELLLPTAEETAQRVLFDIVSVLRVYPGGASLLCNSVKLLLDDRSRGSSFHAQNTKQRSDTSKNSTDSPRSPSAVDSQLRVTSSVTQTNTLASLLALVTSANKHTAGFVRTQLSSPSLVRFLVAKLGAWQRQYRATFTRRILTLMQMVDAVVSSNEQGAPYTVEWAQPYVVQDVVKFAYSGPHDVSVRAVVMLRNAAARCSGSIAKRALWEVLRQCTKTCCGCSSVVDKEYDLSWPTREAFTPRDATVAMFAELVGAMILSGPESTLEQVGSYVEANILSCLAGETRVNLFLLTLVQRVVQDAGTNSRWSPLLPVVQLGVSSLAASRSDRIRVLQLQVLRAVCSRVLVLTQGSNSVSSRAANSRIEAAKKAKATAKQQRHEVAQWRRLLCSERVQSDLRAIIATSSSAVSNGERCSRAAVELARGVLTLSARVEKLAQVRLIWTLH